MMDDLSRRKFLMLGAFCGISGLTGVYAVTGVLAFEVKTHPFQEG
jgi:hypothetical protein